MKLRRCFCNKPSICSHHKTSPVYVFFLISSNVEFHEQSGPIFCLLLRVSSGYAQPITGQVTEVTCPVIGQAQPEHNPNKKQKTGPGPRTRTRPSQQWRKSWHLNDSLFSLREWLAFGGTLPGPGFRFKMKCSFIDIKNPGMEIRQFYDHLISTVGTPVSILQSSLNPWS